MNNKTLLIVLLLTCILEGMNLQQKLAYELFSLGGNLLLHSLSDLHNLETNLLECSPTLKELSTSIDAWSEILENCDYIITDSNRLQQLKISLQLYHGSGYNDALSVLLQFRNSFSDIMSQINAEQLKNTPFQIWRRDGTMELQGLLSQLEAFWNEKDFELLCNKIEKSINRLMIEREQVINQCEKGPQTIIKILNYKAEEIEEIIKECSDSLRTIVRIKPIVDDKKVIITGKPDGQCCGQEQTQEPSYPTQSIQTTIANRILLEINSNPSNLIQQSDFTNPVPIYDETKVNTSIFTEYGYGYWVKFLFAYPIFLTDGKKAVWHFVSRLSADQTNQDSIMGSRMLAVWVGEGFYYFATCDEPNNLNDTTKKVYYPQDLDGLWTYIYYSYSAQKNKSVAFIKFGSENFQMVTFSVQNPSTSWVRFTVGGKDNNRWAGFNGLFNQIYFSTEPGVFLDSDSDFMGKLLQYTQPKDLIPESNNYELVSNIQQRDPDTIQVFSIIGTSNQPLFPQEYALNGWFKWEVPQQQQQWHIIFRVQIQQPLHDGVFGDRTLAAWVGKENEGIIHFATYTYTALGGSGNVNVVQNIPHQNRHTEWFFVQFGYSRPQKEAIALIQWKKSAEIKDYKNINHFQVPQYYIYVGKENFYPGFKGKIAFVNFNFGEGLKIKTIGDYQMIIIDLIYQFQQIFDEQSFIPGCSYFIEDKCFNCLEGWDFLALSNQCIPICGDNLIYGTEECDDGNIIPFDGCFNCKFQCAENCKICEFGRCIQCQFGYKLKSQYCYPVCGDALTLDSEECDDGNIEKFDGCYKCINSCQIECKLCFNQLCFQCEDGWQLISNRCEQVCNDNLLAILSLEQCDNDGDIYCNDCVQLCQDNCIYCLTYNHCKFCRYPFELVNGICTSICGDSIVIVGFEQCDDGNDIQFDGCYQCQLQCSYGCVQCQNNNICAECDPSLAKLNDRTMKCEQIHDDIELDEEVVEVNDKQCGNGLLNSLYEECDDGNIEGGDGCSAYCNIETQFICTNVEDSLSVCIFLESPQYKLESLSNKKSQSQILQLSFTQKVKLSTQLSFENITIFTVLPTTRYDINIIPLVECSNEFNQSKYQISIIFRDPVDNPVLRVEIEKSTIINELNQYLVDNRQEINLGNPFVISEATQQTVTKIVSMNDAMIYSMISISLFALLTGNTIIFLNLLDLLQSLSYLRYMQYQFPQHLKQFLDTYTKISLAPILDFLKVDYFLSKLNGGTLPLKKKDVQSELNTYFLMNSKSCYFSIMLSLFSYCVFCLITNSRTFYWLRYFETRFWENSKYLKFYRFIQQNIIRKCLLLKIKYFSLGIFQIYYSILHQLLFSALLQFPHYTFDSAFDIFNSINAIIVLLFILFSTIKFLSISSRQIKDIRKWKYFFNESINGFWSKNYKSFQIYRVTFYIFNIVAFMNCPELQSILLSMSSMIYLIYLIKYTPLKCQYDFIKLIFKEIFFLIITGSFLIYSFQLSNELLLLCGWIHIGLFSMMLASSLIFDMINHLIKAYEHYKNLKLQLEINKLQQFYNNRLQRFIFDVPQNQIVYDKESNK